MSYVATFNSLSASLLAYQNRNDDRFIAAIPSFFAFAIQRMSRDLKTLGLDCFATFQFNFGNSPILEKPSDWRATLYLKYFTGQGNTVSNLLLPRSKPYLDLYWPDNSLKAPPKYYADYDYTHFYIAPNPDQAYDGELGYFATLSPLDENNQVNWATKYAPDTIFKALQIEANIFLQNYADVEFFTNAYNASMQKLVEENIVRKLDQNYDRSIG